MSDSGAQTGQGNSSNILKNVVRTMLPWYGALVAIYPPIHAVYGWLSSAGIYSGSWQTAIFNFCVTAGVCACFVPGGAFLGGTLGCLLCLPGAAILSFFGLDFIESAKRIVQSFAIVGGAALGLLMVYLVVSTPGYISNQLASNGSDKFYAICGALVLIVTYVVYGRKVFEWIKRFKAELKEQA